MEDKKNGIGPKAKYIRKKISKYCLPMVEIWKHWLFIFCYPNMACALKYKSQELTSWIGLFCKWHLVYNFSSFLVTRAAMQWNDERQLRLIQENTSLGIFQHKLVNRESGSLYNEIAKILTILKIFCGRPNKE